MSRGRAHAIAAVCMLMITLVASSSCTFHAEEEDSFSLVQVEHYMPQRPAETLIGTESASITHEANDEKAHLGRASKNNNTVGKPAYEKEIFDSASNVLPRHGDSQTLYFIVIPMMRSAAKMAVLCLACAAVYYLCTNCYRRAHGLKADAGGPIQEPKAPPTNWTCPVRNQRTPVAQGRTDSKPTNSTHSITHQLLDKIGIFRCLEGLGKTRKKPREHSLKADAGDSSTSEAPRALPAVKCPATVNLEDGHPNFRGTWKCVAVQGDPEGLMTDMEVGYYSIALAKAVGFGAGKLTREYTHEGSYLKFKEYGVMSREQELNISGEEQRTTNDALVKPYWDSESPHILVSEGMDLEKEKPWTWSTTRQYFINKDTLVHDVSTRSGSVATWVWHRSKAAAGSSELLPNDAKAESDTVSSPSEDAPSES